MPILPSGTFDPSQHSDMRKKDIIPPGNYIFKITKQELVSTKDQTGTMLVMDVVVAAGRYKGNVLVNHLNIVNSSDKAVKIAAEELATLSRACGHPEPLQNTDILNNIAFVGTIDVEPASGKYGPKNYFTGYKSAAGLTEPPINPEPDENMLNIMRGVAQTTETQETSTPPPPPNRQTSPSPSEQKEPPEPRTPQPPW